MSPRWLIALPLLLLTLNARAEDLKPIMTTRGKSLLHETFDGDNLPKTWTVNKGLWTIEQSALKGAEKASDEHSAVAGLLLELPKTFQVQFDFRFDGAKTLHLSFNGKGQGQRNESSTRKRTHFSLVDLLETARV